MSLRDLAYKTLRLSNDVRAVRKGRIAKRVQRRVLGRIIRRLTR